MCHYANSHTSKIGKEKIILGRFAPAKHSQRRDGRFIFPSSSILLIKASCSCVCVCESVCGTFVRFIEKSKTDTDFSRSGKSCYIKW